MPPARFALVLSGVGWLARPMEDASKKPLPVSQWPHPKGIMVGFAKAPLSQTRPLFPWGGATDSQVEVFWRHLPSVWRATPPQTEQEQIGRAACAARPICSCSVKLPEAMLWKREKTSTCESSAPPQEEEGCVGERFALTNATLFLLGRGARELESPAKKRAIY